MKQKTAACRPLKNNNHHKHQSPNGPNVPQTLLRLNASEPTMCTPAVISWFISYNPSDYSYSKGIINQSFWSYDHQLSYRLGPHFVYSCPPRPPRLTVSSHIHSIRSRIRSRIRNPLGSRNLQMCLTDGRWVVKSAWYTASIHTLQTNCICIELCIHMYCMYLYKVCV